MGYLLLSVITLLISTVLCDVEISFMKAVPRLNNSMYCDYYFACHAEGETLQWIVNNNNISDYSGQSVGNVFTGSISSCSYTTTLFLLRPMPPGLSIFGSLLILSCRSSIDFTVTCTNGSVSNMTNSPEKEQNARAESNITLVNLEHLLNGNLVNADSSSCTNIFICGVDNTFLSWQIQGESIVFTNFDVVGRVRQRVQDTVDLQGILIGNEPYSLVVVMIVIGSAEINVTCGYRQTTASFVSTTCSNNLETTTSEISTVGESTTSDSTPVINIAIIIGTVVGVAVVVVLIILIILFSGYLWIKEKKKINRLRNKVISMQKDDDIPMRRIHKRSSEANNTATQMKMEDVACHNKNEDDELAKDEMYLTPIKVDIFKKKFRNVEASVIEEEFKVLMNVTRSSESQDEGAKNQEKNRFHSSYIPYDSSRVKLESVDGSDYINASYINGYKDGKEKTYIATQEPMTTTIVDFWRMIYEQRVTTIVRFREEGQLNDVLYWPEEEMTVNQNGTNLLVEHEKLKHFIDFDVRTVTIRKHSNAGNETPLRIRHYFFKTWPDAGIPQFSFPLIQFICHIKSKRVQDDISPIVVHSKAGIGRTGVFIALYAMMEQMEEDKEIGIFAFVKSMRLNRRYMVGFANQYLFIYKALNELCISGDTSLKAAIDLRKKIDGKDITNEFELLSTVGRLQIRSEQSHAFRNLSKNSSASSLPYNDSRVKLVSTDNDYISACFVHGYKTKNAYIAAQIPLKETIQDFWNMIWEQGSQTIVLLGPMQEGNMRFSKFWPHRSQKYGTLMVTLDSEKLIHNHKERIILISKDNEIQKVTFYHYMNWLEHEQPENTDEILQLIERLKSQEGRRNRKVVMCSDGAGRTGAFITIREMIKMFREVGYVDFFKLIVLLRIDRADLVRKVEHYKFCHRVLADYIDKKPYAN